MLVRDLEREVTVFVSPGSVVAPHRITVCRDRSTVLLSIVHWSDLVRLFLLFKNYFFRFSLYRVQCSSEHFWKPNLQLGPRKFLSQAVHRATAEKQRQTIPKTASPFHWHFCWVRVKFAEPDGQSQVERLEEFKSYQLGSDFKLSIMLEGRLLCTLC